MRPVVCDRGGADVRSDQLGRQQQAVQRWICWRSSGSMQSLAHTRSVRSSTPRSTRPPPEEHDSISRPGCRARSSSRSR